MQWENRTGPANVQIGEVSPFIVACAELSHQHASCGMRSTSLCWRFPVPLLGKYMALFCMLIHEDSLALLVLNPRAVVLPWLMGEILGTRLE